MGEDETIVFAVSAVLAVVGLFRTGTGRLHALHFRNNPGIGLIKLSVWIAMGWIAFVLWRHADPSVTGIYVWFYLVMGLAAVKLFGQIGGAVFVRFRVDVCERKNFPGAFLLGAFVLGTGLIFGGSLWGEADPDGDGEGGWWIPLGFFLLGWTSLVALLGIFFWREPGSIRGQLLQNRSFPDARAGATYLIGLAIVLAEAVAGDFHGWWHGLMAVGVVGVMLGAHELFLFLGHKATGGRVLEALPRWMESGFYLLCGIGSWSVNRILDRVTVPGL